MVTSIDMVIKEKARTLFPEPRRAIMYTPMNVASKTISQIRKDLEQIAQNYGPCDVENR